MIGKRFLHPLILFPALLLVLAPFILFGMMSVLVFESGLTPLYHKRTEIAAQGVQRRLEFGIQMFGGLSMLRDVDAVLEEVRVTNPSIDFIAVTDADGSILHWSAGTDTGLDDPAALVGARQRTDFDALAQRFDAAYTALFGASMLTATPETARRVENFVITSLPLGRAEAPAGAVHVGVDVGLFKRIRLEVAFDAATILLASALIGYELLRLLFARHIRRPREMLFFIGERLRRRDLRFVPQSDGPGVIAALVARSNAFLNNAAHRAAALAPRAKEAYHLPDQGARPKAVSLPAAEYLRLPLFLFFLSETVLRPFLPVFLGDLPATPLVSSDMQTGMAMAAFMGTSILGVILASFVADRLSVRSVFIAGVAFSVVGMLGHALVQDAGQAMAARALVGLGYGTVYAAGQVYVAQHAPAQRRASGFSLFLGVVVAAEICGPAIGGILADRLGFEAAFLLASVTLVLSALLAFRVLPRHRPDHDGVDEKPPQRAASNRLRDVLGIVTNARFTMLQLCFSIPSKLVLTGGLFLLAPLAVLDVGGSTADAGRVIMIYGGAVLLTAAWLARIADARGWFANWVFFGAVLAGAGLCLPVFWPSMPGLALSVLLLGLGQAMSIPSQITFLLAVSSREVGVVGQGGTLGMFRFFERIGSLLGPLVAGILLTIQTPVEAMFTLGIGALMASSLGAAYFLVVGEQDEEETIDALLVEI